ncbi:MAG TPA: DUF885 domain-containing protein [Micromonosporaceae bacterium]
MGIIDNIANSYVDEWAPLDPVGATYVGIDTYAAQLTDMSPAGFEALVALDRRTLAALAKTSPATEGERVAKDAMVERLSLSVARYDAGETTSEMNVISSGLHNIRGIFDLMPRSGDDAAENIASRMAAVPGALLDYRRTVLEAAHAGHISSRHQMVEIAQQCDAWVDPNGDNFWTGLVERIAAESPVPESLLAELERDAQAANAATVAFGEFLRTEMAPMAPEKEAVGRERYALASQYFLGAKVDLDETYAWGFDELARLESEMRTVANRIVPGGSVDDAVAELDSQPIRNISGKEPFRDWMQQLADAAIDELNGTHFDIPEQVRRIECMIAPTSDGGIYYTGPSEDFSRPGRMWWAVPAGVNEFSTWREVTTVYHEGVPGHHLQVAQTAVRSELLNRWQRLMSWCSGHGEGWALYAERLMDELGYLDDPGNRLGMLDAQAFRACRVIVDIGMHLELEIPADNPFGFHPGERWTPELGWEFLRAHCRVPEEQLRFELNRYLGWPGQAPAYKVGERIWLSARDDAKKRRGAAFDLKTFHREALNLGSLGLDPFRAAVDRM